MSYVSRNQDITGSLVRIVNCKIVGNLYLQQWDVAKNKVAILLGQSEKTFEI